MVQLVETPGLMERTLPRAVSDLKVEIRIVGLQAGQEVSRSLVSAILGLMAEMEVMVGPEAPALVEVAAQVGQKVMVVQLGQSRAEMMAEPVVGVVTVER